MGFGAEIAAQIASECFRYLDAPVMRLGCKNVAAIPHSPALERVILPQNEDVSESLSQLLRF